MVGLLNSPVFFFVFFFKNLAIVEKKTGKTMPTQLKTNSQEEDLDSITNLVLAH